MMQRGHCSQRRRVCEQIYPIPGKSVAKIASIPTSGMFQTSPRTIGTPQVLHGGGGALTHGQAVSQGVLSVAGPPALTRFYLRRAEDFPDIHLPPIAEFHPNMLPSGRPDARSYGIHLCWGSWRGKKSVKWATNQMRRKLWRYEWV
jgi:hypothetical protein